MSGSIPAARAAVPQRSRASTARREVIAVASDVDAQPEHDGAQVEVAGAAAARAAHESVEGEACAGERSDKFGSVLWRLHAPFFASISESLAAGSRSRRAVAGVTRIAAREFVSGESVCY